MGEFRFDADYDLVTRDEFLEESKNLLSEEIKYPRFIYKHSTRPNHSPKTGVCAPNQVNIFEQRLQEANLEMVRDIDIIMKNDPNSIIIIAGDHGPYLTKNCTLSLASYKISEISRLDIQDRFGTFLAIRWPTQNFEEYDDITVLQDLFPAVFAYLFEDTRFLDAKVTPVTIPGEYHLNGAGVIDGVINGGINDGEPLFIGTE